MNALSIIPPAFFAALLFLPLAASADTCLTTDCHADISAKKNLHSPVEEGDCLLCHIQNAPKHPGGEGDPFELIQGAELCYQCHDTMGQKKVVHYPVADGDCLSCHNPHGAEGRFLLPNDEDQSETCMQCHDPELFEQEHLHGPVAVGACTECHDPHESDHQARLKTDLRQTCLKCHVTMAEGMASAKVVHAAAQEQGCTTCHNPHSAPLPQLLSEAMPELCFNCHETVKETADTAEVKHKALYRDRSCGTCHATHYSEFDALLPLSQKDTCLSCHGKDDFKKTDALRNIRKELEGKTVLHGPIQDGECAACHSPHGSDNTRLLTGPYPDAFYAPYKEGSYDFCLQCHNKSMLSFPDTSIYTEFRNGKQNLHFLHVADPRKGRTCRACHQPHASDSEKLISKKGSSFGAWNIPIRFAPTPTGGSCSPGCHKTVKYDRKDPATN